MTSEKSGGAGRGWSVGVGRMTVIARGGSSEETADDSPVGRMEDGPSESSTTVAASQACCKLKPDGDDCSSS